MGDYTPLGTLLMNEQAKDDFSKDVVDYVFLHEVGHDQVGSMGRTLFWAIYLSSGLLLIAGMIASPSILLEAVESAPSIVMIPVYTAVALGVSLGAIIPFTLVCWIDETQLSYSLSLKSESHNTGLFWRKSKKNPKSDSSARSVSESSIRRKHLSSGSHGSEDSAAHRVEM
ncbi:hypothetical protein ACFQL0_20535 [Haloplanus litoreus]|uniref:hypothetical protein n=1 Tax=Haloplanus litoreus TaxID=767515 RepID=UPI0036161FF2